MSNLTIKGHKHYVQKYTKSTFLVQCTPDIVAMFIVANRITWPGTGGPKWTLYPSALYYF